MVPIHKEALDMLPSLLVLIKVGMLSIVNVVTHNKQKFKNKRYFVGTFYN